MQPTAKSSSLVGMAWGIASKAARGVLCREPGTAAPPAACDGLNRQQRHRHGLAEGCLMLYEDCCTAARGGGSAGAVVPQCCWAVAQPMCFQLAFALLQHIHSKIFCRVQSATLHPVLSPCYTLMRSLQLQLLLGSLLCPRLAHTLERELRKRHVWGELFLSPPRSSLIF